MPDVPAAAAAVQYDQMGRRIKSKKELALAAESKRLVEAATAQKDKDVSQMKKFKLATSQNIEQQLQQQPDRKSSSGHAEDGSSSSCSGRDSAVSTASSASAAAAAGVEEYGGVAPTPAPAASAAADAAPPTPIDEDALRQHIRAEVVGEYRATMERLLHGQLVIAQSRTEQAIAAVEALWRAQFQELEAKHARDVREMQHRDIDDKDTLHIEIDGLTTQKVSLHAKLKDLEEENARLRKQLQLQLTDRAAQVAAASSIASSSSSAPAVGGRKINQKQTQQQQQQQQQARKQQLRVQDDDDEEEDVEAEEEDDDDGNDNENDGEEKAQGGEDDADMEVTSAAAVPFMAVNGNKKGPSQLQQQPKRASGGKRRGSMVSGGGGGGGGGGGAPVPGPDENQIEEVVPVAAKRYNLRKRT